MPAWHPLCMGLSLQGHGCSAAPWPVPVPPTWERRQHSRASACSQLCNGLSEPLGPYHLVQSLGRPQRPLARADQEPTCTTRGCGASGPREPPRTARHSPSSLRPLPRAPCQHRTQRGGEHGPRPQGAPRLQGRRRQVENCLRWPATVGGGRQAAL